MLEQDHPGDGNPGQMALRAEDISLDIKNTMFQSDRVDIYSLRSQQDTVVKEVRLIGLYETDIKALGDAVSVLKRLQHPSLLSYGDIVDTTNTIYLYMPRCAYSLDIWLRIHRENEQDIFKNANFPFISQVVSALAYLHNSEKRDAAGKLIGAIAHGSISLSNILLDESGQQAMLSDTGIGKGTICNIRSIYAAPEVQMGKKPTPASDMWSLGVVLYELVTGKKPQFLNNRSPRDTFAPKWSPDLSDIQNTSSRNIIGRLLVLEPNKRITASALVEVLNFKNTFMPIKHEVEPQHHITLHLQVQSERVQRNAPNVPEQHVPETSVAEDQLSISEYNATRECQREVKQERLSTSTQVYPVPNQPANSTENSHATIGINTENNFQAPRVAGSPAPNAPLNPAPPGSNVGNPVVPMRYPLIPWTQLMDAAFRGQKNKVQNLIHSNRDIGKQNSAGMTALMLAAWKGHLEIVKLLVGHENEKRADNGWTALMFAAYHKHKKVANYLLSCDNNRSRWTSLMYSAALNPIPKPEAYSSKCGEVDIIGRTALIIAAHSENASAVKELFKVEQLISQWTLLMYAVAIKDKNVLLSRISEDSRRKDKCGYTALMYAVIFNYMDGACELLKYETNVQAHDGYTALMIAANRKNLEMVRLLGPYECKRLNSKGKTARRIAAEHGYLDIVSFLADYEEDESLDALKQTASNSRIKPEREHKLGSQIYPKREIRR